jgi:ribosomal protein S18 acetylase RimI-like enzyme
VYVAPGPLPTRVGALGLGLALVRAGARLPTPEALVRRPTPDEGAAVAALLHESAAGMYDRFAGGRERALRTLERAFQEPGNSAAAEVIWVAAPEGEVGAAMAAFPVDEALPRSRAFLRMALRGAPFWRWPGALRLYWLCCRASPSPPSAAFYIDALATNPAQRRRGLARALLDEAERQAKTRGLPAVALETTLDNRPARSLYRSAGFDEVAYRPAARALPGFVALVRPLD